MSKIRRFKKKFIRVCVVALSFLQISCSVFGIRSEENPRYTVLENQGDKEIRSYSGYIVAKTVSTGEFRVAQREAFQRLADYIFGNNLSKQKISMTAPVVQKESSTNQKIAMTAPVVQTASPRGWEMTFMMPSEYTMANLPTPKDDRITLEEIPPKVFGVIRYSGLARTKAKNQMAEELKSWLESKLQYKILAGPSFAGYDPPWTLSFLRRNEVMYELGSRK